MSAALDEQTVDAIARLRSAIGSVVRGKNDVVDLVITCVLAGGHLLLEDVPGVGKTTMASALAVSLGGEFSRIQFTADLLPGDITGVPILDMQSRTFHFRKGPLFANVVLADEINRTSPKTQSALFEAMEEGTVTVDGEAHPLRDPFFVLATQNPWDFHGTFPLPDSQLDRFLMRLRMGYPDRESEREVVRQGGRVRRVPETVVELSQVRELQQVAERVKVSREIEDYLLDLVRTTRHDSRLLRGVSPRGAQALYRAVKARAMVAGRPFAVPEDVRALAAPVLGHRVLARSRNTEGAIAGERVVAAILDGLKPPG